MDHGPPKKLRGTQSPDPSGQICGTLSWRRKAADHRIFTRSCERRRATEVRSLVSNTSVFSHWLTCRVCDNTSHPFCWLISWLVQQNCSMHHSKGVGILKPVLSHSRKNKEKSGIARQTNHPLLKLETTVSSHARHLDANLDMIDRYARTYLCRLQPPFRT
jgi:hypothetical protein